MSANPVSKDPLLAELEALRRRVAELQSLEQRCHRAEAALKAFESRNRLLGDSAPLGIFTVDENANLVGINRKMRERLPLAMSGDAGGIAAFDMLAPFGAHVCEALQRSSAAGRNGRCGSFRTQFPGGARAPAFSVESRC